MDPNLFGFGGGWGGGGGCGGGVPYALMGAPAIAPSGVTCPNPAAMTIDPCNPQLQYMLQQAWAKQQYSLAAAQRGALTRDIASQPARPIGIGTGAPPTTANPLVAGTTSQTFSITPFNGGSYCFVDLDVSRTMGANDFLITGLSIGDWNIPITGPIACDVFSPDAIHPLLELGSTECNGSFNITVFNSSTSTLRFNGVLYAIPRGGAGRGGPCLVP